MNDKVKEAYEFLGLPEEVQMEEVNRRFDMLLKRRRSIGAPGTAEALAFEKEVQAYRLILDTHAKQEVEEAESSRLQKYGRFAGTARRLEDFFRLYRTQVIIGIIAVAVLIGGGIAYKNHLDKQRYLASLPPVDLNIMFLGNFMAEDDPEGDGAPLEAAILKSFPDWKRVETRLIPLTSNGGATEVAYRQKAMAEMSVDPPDLVVLDKDTLAWLAQGDGLETLKDSWLTEWLGGKNGEGVVEKAVDADDGIEAVYGINFTDSKLAASLPVLHNDTKLIAGVFANSKNHDKALEFLKEAAEQESAK
ncbi:hypothetical protein D3C81_217890 [compost metagenome]